MSKLRIAVGIPAYGGNITVEQAQMWLAFGNTLGASENFELAWFGYMDTQPVDKTRNKIVEHAIQAKADWVLMIDADTFVYPQADADPGFLLLRMIADANRAGAMLVGAPYALRGFPDQLAVYREVEPSTKNPHGLEAISVADGPRQMYEAHAVGAGCIAINLTRLLVRHHWGADLTVKKTTLGDHPGQQTQVELRRGVQFQFTVLSEDLDFCEQIRDIGGRILVDGRVTTGHMSRSKPLYSRA